MTPGIDDQYAVVDVLIEGEDALYRVRQADTQATLLVRPASARRTLRLRNELELGRSLSSPAILRPLQLRQAGERLLLELEDFPGQALTQTLGQPLAMDRFLPLALALARAVHDLHQAEVVHRDLRPANVLLDEARGAVKLTGLGLASRVPREQPSLRPAALLEHDLAYMAPEQSGRMNRAVDLRSDLYSLGVILYQMATGKLPFSGRDALEWVHCHLAEVPAPPWEIAPSVPRAIGRILLKLLAKDPDERYQSCRSVQRDLQHCWDQWRQRGTIEEFTAGAHDVPQRLTIPQKVYGRERERQRLADLLRQVRTGGQRAMVLVSGPAGIGKSSLLRSVQEMAQSSEAILACGKFDRGQAGRPYSAWGQALGELAEHVLAGSEHRLVELRQQLEAQLGETARLIVDLAPRMQAILGCVPPPAALPPTEMTHNRFLLAITRCLQAAASAQHPLLLFLDDLQWADQPSLDLLAAVALGGQLQHTLLLGAYRAEEVTTDHPLADVLAALRHNGLSLEEVVLGPLSRAGIGELIGDALGEDRDHSAELADLVQHKTGGNPLFVTQFLMAVHRDGLLEYDPDEGAWRWDLAGIQHRQYTDNVIELMARRIKQLPPATQEAMAVAACLGTQFELQMLAAVREQGAAQAQQELREAVEQELLVRKDGALRFVHDRVCQAADDLLDERQRRLMHLKIGRMLLREWTPQRLGERVFEVVDHFQRAEAPLEDAGERLRLAELYLLAGRKAEDSIAYAAARGYLEAGLALLGTAREAQYPQLAFGLHFHHAQALWMLGQLPAAEEELAALVPHCDTPTRLAEVSAVRLAIATASGQNQLAVQIGVQCLERCGLPTSAHPTAAQVQQQVSEFERRLGGRDFSALLELPELTDPQRLALLNLLVALTSPAYYSDAGLYTLLCYLMANLSLEAGNSDAAAVTYASLALIISLSGGKQAWERSRELGRVAQELAERRQASWCIGKIMVYRWAGVEVPHRPLRECIEQLQRAEARTSASGDQTWHHFALYKELGLSLASGESLGDLIRKCESYRMACQKAGFTYLAEMAEMVQRLALSWCGIDPGQRRELQQQEQRFVQEVLPQRVASVRCSYWGLQTLQRFLVGDYAGVLEAAGRWKELSWSVVWTVQIPEQLLLGALARTALMAAAAPSQQATWRQEVQEALRQLRDYADTCPQNFQASWALVAAEQARLAGQDEDATRRFDEAISAAAEHGLVHQEAIAAEAAARFYQQRGLAVMAGLCLKRAVDAYRRWGAQAKVEQLRRSYPQVLAGEDASGAGETDASMLDAAALVRAQQAISGQIEMGKLIQSLMKVLLHSAGAQRGLLLLNRQGELWVEEAAGFREPVPGLPRPAGWFADVPMAVIRYVQRTGERVLLGDAREPNAFSHDPYLQREHPRSILCLPLQRLARVIGMVYLENNLSANVFTAGRVALLEALAAQAAISLETARLYRELKEENEERRRAEEAAAAAQRQFQALLDNAPAAVFLKDLQGHYLLVSRFFSDLRGQPREWFVSKTIHDLYPREVADELQRHDQAVLEAGHEMQWEETIPLADGLHIFLVVRFPLLDEQGKPYALCGIGTDITERVQAERQLRLSEEKFARTFQLTPNCMSVTTLEGRFLAVNDAFTRVTGYRPEEVLGKTGYEIGNWVHPHDCLQMVRELQHKQEIRNVETQFRAKDGRVIDGLYSARLVEFEGQPCILSITQDITERVQAERQLRLSEEKFARTFQLNPDSMAIATTDGHYLAVNEAFCRATGYRPEEVVGKTSAELGNWVNPADRQFMVEALKKHGECRNLETQFRQKDGRVVDGIISARLIDFEQQPCVLSITQDITERKQHEREREQLLERERSARREAEEANRLKDEFLAMLSHELRTPLTSILGWAQLLRGNTPDASELAEGLASIERNAQAEVQLVQDLLDVSRIIHGGLDLQVEPLSLAVVVRAALQSLRIAAQARRVELILGPMDDQAVVGGDRQRLQQVVWNLVNNAVKFTPAGGKVHVSIERKQGSVHLVVRDTGIGIRPEFLPQLFSRFRQADTSRTRRYGGLGLGLAIVKHLVELHGGRVWAQSPGENQGSTFTVELPTIEAAAPERPAGPEAGEQEQPARLRVLAVDDDAGTRQVLGAVFRGAGEIRLAGSAAEAMRILGHWTPDVMLCDIGMPEQDGYQFIRQVRAMPGAKGHIPAVALTAYASSEDALRAREAGFELHLPKPFAPAQLLEIVQRLASSHVH